MWRDGAAVFLWPEESLVITLKEYVDNLHGGVSVLRKIAVMDMEIHD